LQYSQMNKNHLECIEGTRYKDRSYDIQPNALKWILLLFEYQPTLDLTTWLQFTQMRGEIAYMSCVLRKFEYVNNARGVFRGGRAKCIRRQMYLHPETCLCNEASCRYADCVWSKTLTLIPLRVSNLSNSSCTNLLKAT
jgi:hypothetical protein